MTPLEINLIQQGSKVLLEFREKNRWVGLRASWNQKKGYTEQFSGQGRRFKDQSGLLLFAHEHYHCTYHLQVSHRTTGHPASDLFQLDGLLPGFQLHFWCRPGGLWLVAWKTSSMPVAAFTTFDDVPDLFEFVNRFSLSHKAPAA